MLQRDVLGGATRILACYSVHLIVLKVGTVEFGIGKASLSWLIVALARYFVRYEVARRIRHTTLAKSLIFGHSLQLRVYLADLLQWHIDLALADRRILTQICLLVEADVISASHSRDDWTLVLTLLSGQVTD